MFYHVEEGSAVIQVNAIVLRIGQISGVWSQRHSQVCEFQISLKNHDGLFFFFFLQ